jgi:hypothetical protein
MSTLNPFKILLIYLNSFNLIVLTRLGDLITTILGLNEFISSINIAFFL